MEQDVFKVYLNSCDYDKMYQDIEYINMVGYSQSFKTWEAIKGLVEWKDKKVADLGCFHGYFSFKIAELGGKPTGMDRSATVLKTTEMLNEVYGFPITTKVWVGGELVSEEFDVSLCLNMLHHCEDEEKTLQNMKSKMAVFEVKYDQSFLINQHFDVIKKVQSHRIGRIILLGVRRES